MNESPLATTANDSLLRNGTLALGVGLIAFSLPALPAPRFFGRLAGLPVPDEPAGTVAVRSVALRDVVMGVGLVSAATHGGRLGPWLLTRMLCDAGDAIAIAIAAARGARSGRLIALGVIAAGATVVDGLLYARARRG